MAEVLEVWELFERQNVETLNEPGWTFLTLKEVSRNAIELR